MSVKERLTSFLKYKNISKAEFGRTIGVSSAFVTSMRKSIQPDKVEKIAHIYPELNIHWLITGEGDMLNCTLIKPLNTNEMLDQVRINEITRYSGLNLRRLAEEAGLKSPQTLYDIRNGKHGISKDVAEKLKQRFPDLSIEWLLTGAGDMLIDKQETIIEEVSTEEVPMAIPIIPATIVDKPNVSLSKDIENNSSDYEKLNLHDLIESVDIAFRVLTEKLAPYVNIGDILLLKRLTGEEEVRSSELHFINTKHQGTYLRYVYDEGENYKLAATNRSPEFIIPKNKVKEIYFVVCRLTFALSMPDLLANKQLRQQSKQISSLVDSVNALVTATVNEGRRTDKVLEMLERQIEKKL